MLCLLSYAQTYLEDGVGIQPTHGEFAALSLRTWRTVYVGAHRRKGTLSDVVSHVITLWTRQFYFDGHIFGRQEGTRTLAHPLVRRALCR